jgi:hypothetical protein
MKQHSQSKGSNAVSEQSVPILTVYVQILNADVWHISTIRSMVNSAHGWPIVLIPF